MSEHYSTLAPNRNDPPRVLISKILQSLSGSGGSTVAGPVLTGTGSPEGIVTAPVGALYNRIDAGVFVATYVKQTGTGNTGWV